MKEQEMQTLEIPKGWTRARIDEICDLINGRAFKPTEWAGQGIPIIRIQNLNNLNAEFNYCNFNVGNKYLVNDGQLLFAWSGTPGTSFGAHIWRRGLGVLNQHIFKVNINEDELDKKYLMYLLNRNISEYVGKAHGTAGLAHITKGKFDGSLVLLPPLPEQHRIVAKIEELFTRLDAGVEALKKIQLQLKRYRQSVLKSAFEGRLTAGWREAHKGELESASVLLEKIQAEHKKSGKYKELPPLDTIDLPELPEGWAWTRVGDLFDVSYGLSEPLSKTSPTDESDVAVIRIPNITEYGDLNLEDLKYHSLDQKQKQLLLLKKGDVLFNWRNAPKWIGRTAVFNREGDYINASFLLRLRPIVIGYSDFISKYLNALRIRGYFLIKVNNAVNQANFNATLTGKVEGPFPPIAEQQTIIEEIEHSFSVVDKIEKTIEQSLKQAERLRQSILKRAFEGKLVPQYPSDEPAEKLLERIRAEKVKNEKPNRKRS